jgi:hypothetical protein
MKPDCKLNYKILSEYNDPANVSTYSSNSVALHHHYRHKGNTNLLPANPPFLQLM